MYFFHLRDMLATWAPSDWSKTFWIVLGFVGQLMFTGRFVVQWFASERAKASVIPMSFWYFSLLGGLLLLFYAVWRQDPVFIAGQSIGTFIYLRNLHLIYKNKKVSDRVKQ